MLARFQFDGVGGRGFRLMLGLLLLAVVLPTAGLLYFINLAVVNQRNLASRQLGEAYQGQLRMVGERIDSYWEQVGRYLDADDTGDSPALFFERSVRSGLADSVICLNRDGSPAYPSLPAPPRTDATGDEPRWIEARRLEDSGHTAEAARK